MSAIKNHLHQMAEHGGPHCLKCYLPVDGRDHSNCGTTETVTVSFAGGMIHVVETGVADDVECTIDVLKVKD